MICLVLSPLLYSIYTHGLELSITSFCKILQYANDIVLFHGSGSIGEVSCRVNSALYYLGQWLLAHGLSLSLLISFENQAINLTDKAKFLGIYLDNGLNGIAHSEHIIKKCEIGINVLRAVAGVWWGAHPYPLKLLYNALVRSHMDYGMFVLIPLTNQLLKN